MYDIAKAGLASGRYTRQTAPFRQRGVEAPTGRPHVGQNLQPTSSSEPHAGQFSVVRSWPQCGQNVIGRPGGSSSLHAVQRSPLCGTTTRGPVGVRVVRGASIDDGAVDLTAGVGTSVGRCGVVASDGPASRPLNAVGESDTFAAANCLNAVGSGLVVASSARSA